MYYRQKLLFLLFFTCFLFISFLSPAVKAEGNSSKFKFALADPRNDKILSPEDTVVLRPGGSAGLEARVIFSNGMHWNVSTDTEALFPEEWVSSDPQVVSVDGGLLKGEAVGTAVVTVKYMGESASVKVKVSPVIALVPSIYSGSFPDNVKMEEEYVLALEKGTSTGIVLTAILADGARGDDVTREADLESENPNIALVHKGHTVAGPVINIIGFIEGSTTVRASLNGVTTSIKVEIVPRKEIESTQSNNSNQSVTEGSGKVVNLNNIYLEERVRLALKKPAGEITDADMAGLTELFFYATGDISGLAYAKNIKKLNLSCDGELKDISVLAGLANLEDLDLNNGPAISDLSPLASLTNLRRFVLYGEQISDLSPLANLTNLREVTIVGDRISDISALANLKNLKWLNFKEGR